MVIFDCDGVLVDTEDIYFSMNQEFIRQNVADAKLASVFNFAYYEHFIGLSSDLMWKEIRKKFNLTPSVDGLIADEKERKAIALKNAALKPIPGVRDFILALKKAGIKLAVASSGRGDIVRLILEKSGLKDFFPVVVTGEDVKNGKPAPDIFLKAASLSAVSPQEAIVIEDSRNGTLGGKAAQMRVVGYVNPKSGTQDLSKADIRVSSFMDPLLYEFCNIRK
ncbi:MAG: Phosphorylated carbohydrates phosphatase [Turneriella sp.]|nr:Phosphorylated carbohydrates phosphatase [Turneriella sp.]